MTTVPTMMMMHDDDDDMMMTMHDDDDDDDDDDDEAGNGDYGADDDDDDDDDDCEMHVTATTVMMLMILCTTVRRMESVRKDVERLFGILKKRFRILKHPSSLRSLNAMEDVFITCCILHNMLLEFDGYKDVGQSMEDYVMRDTTGVVDMEWPEFAQGYYSDDEEEAAPDRRDEMMEEVTERDNTFDDRRHALVNHYNSAKVEGHVYWRKTIKEYMASS